MYLKERDRALKEYLHFTFFQSAWLVCTYLSCISPLFKGTLATPGMPKPYLEVHGT